MPRGQPDFLHPLPVRRVRMASDAEPVRDTWPASIPAVRQVLHQGLDLAKVTILVGENGSGKSTLIEAIAMAYGLPGEGGSTGAMHKTYASESPLHDWLTLERGAGASKWGYFLRAETTHGLFTYLHNNPGPVDPEFHALSHGESFQAMLGTRRFRRDGFFVMDEPEAGLSFSAQLALVGTLKALASDPGSQVLIATHSPVLASIPGAHILQLDDNGLRPSAWAELESVINYTNFLKEPRRYLRHVVD